MRSIVIKTSEGQGGVRRARPGRGSATTSRGLRNGRWRVSRLCDNTIASTGNGDRCRWRLGSAVGCSWRILITELNARLGTCGGTICGVAIGSVAAHSDGTLAVMVGLAVDAGGAMRNGRDRDGRHDIRPAVHRRYGRRLGMVRGRCR
jgi:hypothetical protein